ncbi:hypothetical protein BG015_010214, partial [Linnemannia schmuckeri]
MPTPVGSPISSGIVDRSMDIDTQTTAIAASTTTAATAMDSPTLLPLRTLIVDNYDSYTFNLLQLFDEDQLKNAVVIRNDQFEWPVFEQEILPYFDQIILSPGPGRPERTQDFGICTQILQTSHIPVFGVCLGHQGLGLTHGAAVTYGPEPVHGQIAQIKHDNTGIFQGIPQEFEAVRYHSLVVQENDLPDSLVATAWCHSFPLIAADNISSGSVHISNIDRALGSKVLMGLRHKTLPHHGVQFHPESICTQFGKRMMTNFFCISTKFYAEQNRLDSTLTIPDYIHRLSVVPTEPTAIHTVPSPRHSVKKQPNPFSLFIRALDPSIFPEPEKVFSSLFLTGPRSKAASWWLDSARQPHPMARFSFMGGIETRSVHRQDFFVPGSAQAVLQYSTLHREVFVRRYQDQISESPKRVKLNDGSSETFWDWMSNVMAELGKDNVETTVEGPNGEQCDFDSVPFDFFAGMVGYLGYEMKRESLEGYHTPIEQECRCSDHSNVKTLCSCDCVKQPDASFVLATQAVVFDHFDKRVYVLGVVNNQPGRILDGVGGSVGFDSLEGCRNWVQDVSRSIVHIALDNSTTFNRRNSTITGTLSHAGKSEPYLVKQRHRRQSSAGLLSPFKVDVTEKDYLRAIQDSLDYIHEGESYELCLTTQFRAKVPLYHQSHDKDQHVHGDPAFDLYRILRKLNPAPFSAFLSLPTAADESVLTQGHRHGWVPDAANELVSKLIILSSSPERFLKIGKRPGDEEMADDTSRTVEMKPIKGTVAVAKGCFCKEDEGCGVEEQDGDSADHTQDEDEEDAPARCGTIRDRCAEARRREDQSRIDSLSKNIKERAENLMIVDLIRNDLAHVCKAKSVRVPYLMHVESYETVHQLVTTVRGELFDHVDNTQA